MFRGRSASTGFVKTASRKQGHDREHLGAGAELQDREQICQVIAQDVASYRYRVFAIFHTLQRVADCVYRRQNLDFQTVGIVIRQIAINFVDQIQDPVALFQGEDDRVVLRSQSDELAASLARRGVPHTYHLYAGEGHGFRKVETIEHLYQAIEKFLNTYVIFN